MALQESGEMYLETILMLSQKNNLVRSVDVAEYMGYSKPAVSRGLAKLKQERYILIDQDGYIALTESGRVVAEKMYERHVLLSSFLMQLGVDEETASQGACRIEHVVSDKSFEAMKKYIEKYL